MNGKGADQLLSTGAAAGRLGASRAHIVDLCEQGQLPFCWVGDHRRILRTDLERFRKEAKAKVPRREHLLGLWLGRATAAHIAADPAIALEYGRTRLEQLIVDSPQAAGWLDRWRVLIAAGPEAVMTVLTASDDEAISLRSASPFGGLIPEGERDQIVTSFQQFWPLAEGSQP